MASFRVPHRIRFCALPLCAGPKLSPEINTALDLWTAQVLKYGDAAPWRRAQDLYDTIDAIQHGDAPWKVYKLRYTGPLAPGLPPKWMTTEYELCARNSRTVLHQQLGNVDFKDKIHYAPYRQFDAKGRRVWSDLMSGDWAWKQAVSSVHYIYVLVEIPTNNTTQGSYCAGRGNTRLHFCRGGRGQRQDNGLRSYRPSRISPRISFARRADEHRSPLPWHWCASLRLPPHSKK